MKFSFPPFSCKMPFSIQSQPNFRSVKLCTLGTRYPAILNSEFHYKETLWRQRRKKAHAPTVFAMPCCSRDLALSVLLPSSASSTLPSSPLLLSNPTAINSLLSFFIILKEILDDRYSVHRLNDFKRPFQKTLSKAFQMLI